MGSISKALGSSTQHISTLEFARSLCRVLSIGSNYDGKEQPGTVGLAISGGVDSMALSVLCSNVQDFPHVKHEKKPDEPQCLRNISFKAFIVDHQVRSGSDEEAKAVSSVLEKRGITAEILKINWPESQNSPNLSNFESLARRYRFRLLGKACHNRGINSLLLAHHEDDQVETIVMRLIAGHRRAGLLGIKEQGGIPECYGMHGIYESGGLEIPSPANTPQVPWNASTPRKQLDIETGGIKIYRPLLGFSKDRLIATCKHEKMKWFEDHTNKDPMLTKRNAIRHMYISHAMPVALTKPALLDLSRKIKDSILQEDALIASLLEKCMIRNMNTRVGTVRVQFPTAVDIRAASGNSYVDYRGVAAKILRHVLFIVSPLEHIELVSLNGAIMQIFRGLSDSEGQLVPPKPLTIASVYLQPVKERTPKQERDDFASGEPVKQSENTEWLLSRQLYNNSSELPSISIPLSELKTWTPWKLFDGRYWIRIQYLDSYIPLTIRPFQASDLKKFKASLDDRDRRMLDHVLKNSATGDIRWSLPAVVIYDRSDGKEHVLALPTLGLHTKIATTLLKWEVRYKKVELPGIKFT